MNLTPQFYLELKGDLKKIDPSNLEERRGETKRNRNGKFLNSHAFITFRGAIEHN